MSVSFKQCEKWPNETEISCDWSERAWRAVKALSSSQKSIAELPAVSFIDWLDAFVHTR